MKKLLSLSVILQLTTGFMAIALVATFAVSASRAVARQQLAEHVRATADISRDLFMAMQTIRVERGTVNTAIETVEPAPAELRDDITALRARSEKALVSALEKLAAAALPGTGPAVAEIRQARDELNAMRPQADAALLLSKDRRPGDLSAAWIATVGKLVDTIDTLSERLSGDLTETDPVIAEMIKIKQLAWIVRAAAGTDRLLVGAALAKANGFPAGLQLQIAALTGQIDGAWNIIETDSQSPATPGALKAAVAAADRLYFGELRARRKTIVDQLAAGNKAPISGNEWVKVSNPGLETLIGVANTAFDLSETYAVGQAKAAKHNLIAALVLMFVFLGFGGCTALFVVHRIATPMATIAARMRSVAEGDFDHDIPYEQRADEIGDLARALRVFRDNALSKQRMEGELIRKERLSALGQITATVAHELRNPMGAIRNSVYIIKQAPSGGAAFERPVARIERSIERCERIIADLLSYTRVSELKPHLITADIWIAEVLNDQNVPAGVSLVRDLGAPACSIALDVDRMRQVIINLLDNAAQAMNEAGNGAKPDDRERRIVVATRTVGALFEIAIEDTGPGIPADVLPKVFEPLFSTKSFGTGLGLPTVKQIVEQHGGTVALSSEMGQGTRVTVRLPQRAATDIAA